MRARSATGEMRLTDQIAPLALEPDQLRTAGDDRCRRRGGRGGNLRRRLKSGRGCPRRRLGKSRGWRRGLSGSRSWSRRPSRSLGGSWGRGAGGRRRAVGLRRSCRVLPLWRARARRGVWPWRRFAGRGWRWRRALGDAHPTGTLQQFMPVALHHRGGTEAETSRPGQDRQHASDRRGRPRGCHAIGSARNARPPCESPHPPRCRARDAEVILSDGPRCPGRSIPPPSARAPAPPRPAHPRGSQAQPPDSRRDRGYGRRRTASPVISEVGLAASVSEPSRALPVACEVVSEYVPWLSANSSRGAHERILVEGCTGHAARR